MKRTILILTTLITLSLACSLGDPGGGGEEDTTQIAPTPQSEKRCGDSFCDGPENASNCPDDCEKEEGAPPNNAEPTSNRTFAFHLLIGGDFLSDTTPHCNTDQALLNANLDIFVSEDNQLTSSQDDGVITFESVSRCPDTDYGGHRTVSGPDIIASGTIDADGYHITLKSSDVTESYFTDGSPYSTSNILGDSWWPYEQGTTNGVEGTPLNFSITHETFDELIDSDDPLNFEGSDPSDDGLWWDGNTVIWIYSYDPVE